MADPKVLVVEDDPALLMIVAEAFRGDGLSVVEAATADVAMEVLESIGDQVAVVFSDIDMPGRLNGVSLARVVRERWPAMPVILTSGRVTRDLEQAPGLASFVPKPYDLFRISAVVQEFVRDTTDV